MWSRGGGLTWRSQVGVNPILIPHPTNLALFGHKITLYGFNQGGSYYCRGLKSEQGGYELIFVFPARQAVVFLRIAFDQLAVAALLKTWRHPCISLSYFAPCSQWIVTCLVVHSWTGSRHDAHCCKLSMLYTLWIICVHYCDAVCVRFSELAEQYTQCTLMSFLPPFTSKLPLLKHWYICYYVLLHVLVPGFWVWSV